MNERPTEPYDPADQAPSAPATPGTPPAAPSHVTPARISTTGAPIPEPTAPLPDAAPETQPDPAVFSPQPDRVDRDRIAWERPVQPTPEAWFEPTAASATATMASPTSRRRTSGVLGQVLAAAVIAAILASGGTYFTLRASGALDRPAATATVPGGQTTSAAQPVKIDESSAIIDVAARVSPAVVRIVSTTNPNNIDPTATEGIGSGIIYDKNGWILTNRHVVSGGGKLTVELKDGRRFDGTIYGIDTLTDLAIVKVDATDLPTAAIGDSSTLKVGQTTIAIGSPLGTYTSTVTSGILSATGRSIAVDSGRINNLLQTDTAINPGNSGGPLLDAGGNVIGINTAVAANANGIGFAIPINIARPIMEQAVAGQKLARPYVGIRYEMLDLQRATQLKLSVHEGAYVADGQGANGQTVPAIVPGGPADTAGIRAEDIIVSIEGQAIDTEHPLDSVLTQFAPGRTVTVGLLRNGQQLEVKVTLGVRPADL
ncbi:MAG: trypsin-like peptidase domain-containing protein [Chloroflexota bacterium]